MKDILGQSPSIRKEIEDCRQRAAKIQQDIENLDIVADTVIGTRKNGITGPITIKGYPEPVYKRKRAALRCVKEQMERWEKKLLEQQAAEEAFIQSVKKSDTRIMLRLYSDSGNWRYVARRMNELFPGRKVPYTEDSCRMRYMRLLKGGDEDEI